MKKLFGYAGVRTIMPEIILWMIYLQSTGWSISEVALLQAFFTFLMAIFELPSGMIADKIGKKLSIQLGEILSIGYLILYFFPHNKVLIFIGFTLFAAGLTLVSGSDVALLYNSTGNKKKYVKYLGYFNGIQILGTAIGNSIGGWISQISWAALFITAISFRILAFIFITLFENPTHDIPNEEKEPFRISAIIKFIRGNRKFQLILISTAFSDAAISLSYQFGSVIFSNNNIRAEYISLIFGIISLVGALMAILSGMFFKKFGKKLILYLYFISIISFFFILIISNSYPLLLVLMFILPNVIFEVWSPMLENNIQQMAQESIRATTLSLINLGASLVLTLSSLLISSLTSTYTITNITITICITLLSISAIAYYKLLKQKKGFFDDER